MNNENEFFFQFIENINETNIQINAEKIKDHFPFSKEELQSINSINMKLTPTCLKIKINNIKKTVILRKNITTTIISNLTYKQHILQLKKQIDCYKNRQMLNIIDLTRFYKKISNNKYIINIYPIHPAVKITNNANIELCNSIIVQQANGIYNFYFEYYDFNNNTNFNNLVKELNICKTSVFLNNFVNIFKNYNPYYTITTYKYVNATEIEKYSVKKLYEHVDKIISNSELLKYKPTESDTILYEIEFNYPFDKNSDHIKYLENNRHINFSFSVKPEDAYIVTKILPICY